MICDFNNIELLHGFAGNSQNCHLRCCGQPDALWPEAARLIKPSTAQRAIESTATSKKHEIVVLLPNQCIVSLLYVRKLSIYV